MRNFLCLVRMDWSIEGKKATYLHVRQFLEFVQKTIHGEFAWEIFQPAECKTFGRTVRDDAEDIFEVDEVFADIGDVEYRLLFLRVLLWWIVRTIFPGKWINGPFVSSYTWNTPLKSIAYDHPSWGPGITQSSMLNSPSPGWVVPSALTTSLSFQCQCGGGGLGYIFHGLNVFCWDWGSQCFPRRGKSGRTPETSAQSSPNGWKWPS